MPITDGAGNTYSSYASYAAATSSPSSPSGGSSAPGVPIPYVPGFTARREADGSITYVGNTPEPGYTETYVSGGGSSPAAAPTPAGRTIWDQFIEDVNRITGHTPTTPGIPTPPAAAITCPKGASYLPSTADLLIGCDSGYTRQLFGDTCDCQANVSKPLIAGIPNQLLIIAAAFLLFSKR